MKQLDPLELAKQFQRWLLEQKTLTILAESISEVLLDGAYTSELFDLRVGRADASFEAWITAVLTVHFEEPSELSWQYTPEISRAIRRVYLEPRSVLQADRVRVLTD